MFKIVINTCYGGFGLSDAAMRRLARRLNITIDEARSRYDSFEGMDRRHCPHLVAVVTEMEHRASARYANLKVVEIKSNRYRIDEYDGSESVQTPETMNWVEIPEPDDDDQEAEVVMQLLSGRLPMPKGDIACAQIEGAIDDYLLALEGRDHDSGY